MRCPLKTILDAALAFWLIAAVCIWMMLNGCAATRQVEVQADRKLKRIVVTTAQVIQPDGKIAQLTTKTVTTENEASGSSTQDDTQVPLPAIVGDFGSLARGAAVAGATAMGGPTAGALVSSGIDWITALVYGTGTAAVAGGTGYVAIQGQKRRTRQLVQAEDDYANDLEQAETDDDVKAVKSKHAERQKALGIHTDLTRARHGV